MHLIEKNLIKELRCRLLLKNIRIPEVPINFNLLISDENKTATNHINQDLQKK